MNVGEEPLALTHRGYRFSQPLPIQAWLFQAVVNHSFSSGGYWFSSQWSLKAAVTFIKQLSQREQWTNIQETCAPFPAFSLASCNMGIMP